MTTIDTSKSSPKFNAWAAREVMGWHCKSIPSFAIWCYYRTKETHPEKTKDWLERFPSEATGWWADNVPTDRWVYETDVPASVGYRGLWAPTTDIAAAMQLVDKLIADEAEWDFRYDSVSEKWYAELILPDTHTNSWPTGHADTLPLAICKALYKWKEGEKRTKKQVRGGDLNDAKPD